MKEQYILSIDCGTQSLRGMIFNQQGELLIIAKRSFKPYFSLRPGWGEQNPDVYFNSLKEVCQEIKEKREDLFSKIAGVSVTTLRDSCVLVDKKGKVLRPAILWMDQRTIDKPKPIKRKHAMVIEMIGMKKIADRLNQSCFAHWIQENEPDIWAKTHKYLFLSGYLNYCLTGEFKDSVASQIGHIPFNYKKFVWEKPNSLKHQFFQIEDKKLVEIVPPGEFLGHITKKASELTGIKAGTPVISGGSDKGCETLGVGCINNSVGSISLGSQASIQTTSKKYYETLTFIPPFPAVIKGMYNPEIQIYRGYWMLTWFKQEFAEKEVEEAKRLGVSAEELLNMRLREVSPGCDGLILQPYWGPPVKNPEAKGSIIGFSDVHTRIHIYRAIIEGIGFALLEGIKNIEKKSGVKMKRVMLSGGGSQSDMICQISADIFNRPVYRVQTCETSGLGAAIIGYKAIGVFKDFDEAINEMVHVKDEFLPDKEHVQIYKGLYNEAYKKVYHKLKPVYEGIHSIIK